MSGPHPFPPPLKFVGLDESGGIRSIRDIGFFFGFVAAGLVVVIPALRKGPASGELQARFFSGSRRLKHVGYS